jgi:hypothetical protein
MITPSFHNLRDDGAPLLRVAYCVVPAAERRRCLEVLHSYRSVSHHASG